MPCAQVDAFFGRSRARAGSGSHLDLGRESSSSGGSSGACLREHAQDNLPFVQVLRREALCLARSEIMSADITNGLVEGAFTCGDPRKDDNELHRLKHRTYRMEEPPNKVLQLTSTIAAHGVLRPPCLLRMLAAEYHVGGAEMNEMQVNPPGSIAPRRRNSLTDLDLRRGPGIRVPIFAEIGITITLTSRSLIWVSSAETEATKVPAPYSRFVQRRGRPSRLDSSLHGHHSHMGK